MTEHASVIDRGLNIRSGPGVHYEILDKLDYGDRVTILQHKAHWAEVKPANGSKRGWAHSASLKLDPPPATPPPPDVAPIEHTEPLSKHDHGPLAFLGGLGVFIFLLWLFWRFGAL